MPPHEGRRSSAAKGVSAAAPAALPNNKLTLAEGFTLLPGAEKKSWTSSSEPPASLSSAASTSSLPIVFTLDVRQMLTGPPRHDLTQTRTNIDPASSGKAAKPGTKRKNIGEKGLRGQRKQDILGVRSGVSWFRKPVRFGAEWCSVLTIALT